MISKLKQLNAIVYKHSFLSNCSKQFFSLDYKALQKKVAQYELKTLELHQGNQEIQDVIFDLGYKLEHETKYNEAERNLIIYLNLGDINLKNKQEDVAKQGLGELLYFLQDYSNDADLKSHLQPQTLHRLGQIAVQENDFQLGEKYYKEVVQIIEYEAQNSGDDKPISIDIVKLLSNSYEKLGNIKRNQQDLKTAIEFYYQSHQINQQALPPKHPFALKVQTLLGDSLRKLNQNKEAIPYLKTCFEQLPMDSQKNASLFVIASQALAMAYLNMNEHEQASEIVAKTEKIYEENKELVPALSFANFYHLKATLLKSKNQLDEARKSLDIAIQMASGVLPEDHQLLKTMRSLKI